MWQGNIKTSTRHQHDELPQSQAKTFVFDNDNSKEQREQRVIAACNSFSPNWYIEKGKRNIISISLGRFMTRLFFTKRGKKQKWFQDV